jgi:hypothetical protein
MQGCGNLAGVSGVPRVLKTAQSIHHSPDNRKTSYHFTVFTTTLSYSISQSLESPSLTVSPVHAAETSELAADKARYHQTLKSTLTSSAMSIFASVARTSLRQTVRFLTLQHSVASTNRFQSARSFATHARVQNIARDTSAPSLTQTFRSVAERAQHEAADESFKAGVVYTLLGVSALGAGFLVLAPKDGKTVLQKDLL